MYRRRAFLWQWSFPGSLLRVQSLCGRFPEVAEELPRLVLSFIQRLYGVPELLDLLLLYHHEWLVLPVYLLRLTDLLCVLLLFELVSEVFLVRGAHVRDSFASCFLVRGEHVGVDEAVGVCGRVQVELVRIVCGAVG